MRHHIPWRYVIKPEKSHDLSKEAGMFITRHDHYYKSSKKFFETDVSVIHQGCGFLAQATQKRILIE